MLLRSAEVPKSMRLNVVTMMLKKSSVFYKVAEVTIDTTTLFPKHCGIEHLNENKNHNVFMISGSSQIDEIKCDIVTMILKKNSMFYKVAEVIIDTTTLFTKHFGIGHLNENKKHMFLRSAEVPKSMRLNDVTM